MRPSKSLLSILVVAAATSACSGSQAVTAPKTYDYEVVKIYPHDTGAFTQGLVYRDGILYEGTGLNGESTIRKVKLETGEVIERKNVPSEFFGEGIAVLGNKLYQLTWQSKQGFVYDASNFQLLKTFTYDTEGWGLTHDGKRLIMSDGSDVLRFLDPETLAETGHVAVTEGATPVGQLNELEYIRGEVWANVYTTNRIVRIDPASGKVTGWVQLNGLLTPEDRAQRVDVLNGIAFDEKTGRIFVTGKWWPKLFEIRLK